MTTKPFAESCEQNKVAILAVIAPLFRDCRNVLEIGSGTGQHAVHFAANLPHLVWRKGWGCIFQAASASINASSLQLYCEK